MEGKLVISFLISLALASRFQTVDSSAASSFSSRYHNPSFTNSRVQREKDWHLLRSHFND